MQTGYEALDNLIDIRKPQLILLADKNHAHFASEFSGDIANNICLKQQIDVLELVSCAKEYLIKRLIINQCEVDYRSWYLKKYTDKEFMDIGKAMTDLFETTNRLPTIEELGFMNIRDIKSRITRYSYDNSIVDGKDGLVVFDSFTFNDWNKNKRRQREEKRLIKVLNKLSKKNNLPIIVTYCLDIDKYDEPISIDHISKVVKQYADTIILLDYDTEDVILKVYADNETEQCKLKYNHIYRRFEDYK